MRAIVDGQNISVPDRFLVVSGSVGIYYCDFVFDESWDGWDKTAVFEGSGETIDSIVVDGKAQVPWETLVDNGLMRVGVYGTQNEKRMPTVWSEKFVVRLGTPMGSPGTEPTPSIYEQILNLANSAKETADEAYDIAAEAQDSAKASAENAEAWAVGQRNGQDVPSTDPTYQNNSKFWAEVAQQGAEESGFAFFEIDNETGHMYVTVSENLNEDVRFEINEQTGHLEVIVS